MDSRDGKSATVQKVERKKRTISRKEKMKKNPNNVENREDAEHKEEGNEAKPFAIQSIPYIIPNLFKTFFQ